MHATYAYKKCEKITHFLNMCVHSAHSQCMCSLCAQYLCACANQVRTLEESENKTLSTFYSDFYGAFGPKRQTGFHGTDRNKTE